MQDTVDAGADSGFKFSNEEASNDEGRFVTIDLHNVSPRYEDICPLGLGSKALVFSAIDQQCRRRLAVKKVSVNSQTSPVDLKRLLREIRILRRLDHENIVRICHTLVSHKGDTSCSSQNNQTQSPASEITANAVYIGMELMDTDLRSILKQEKLSPCYVQLFTYQMLRGLKYIHSANVIHRDLCPSNLFVNIDTLMLKIGDFGVSRIYDSSYEHQRQMSMASTTTSYQAPEILLHPHHYDKAIDVWAAGCIFAEMISGKPLFQSPGSSEHIDLILSSVSVTLQTWRSVTDAACDNEDCCRFHRSFGDRENYGQPPVPLSSLLPEASAKALNLLRQLLTFDPMDRVTAVDALMHPYLAPFGNPADEQVCAEPFHIEDELDDFNICHYQELINDQLSAATSQQSSEHSEYPAETSLEDGNYISRPAGKHSMSQNDSCKNLLALIDSSNHPSNASNHSPAVTMSESEARTMACDFDYGVQINDGSIVSRDRMCRDFQPITCDTACFDPYKWDSAARGQDVAVASTGLDIVETAKPLATPVYSKAVDVSQDPGSDHGYHSSYCSSNLSHGKTHPHSMWSLSSPDVSVDHEKGGPGHRATTPDLKSPGVVVESEDTHFDRLSPTFGSEIARGSEQSESGRRRHKEDLPRHHQSYHHSSLYLHHHHHHHHHHKHHRHSSRHGQQQQAQGGATQRTSSNEDNSASRCHQRRCVVNDIVPEVAEEPSPDLPRPSDRVKESDKYKNSSSDSDSKDRVEQRSKMCRFSRKPSKTSPSSSSSSKQNSPLVPDSGFHEPSDDAPAISDKPAEDATGASDEVSESSSTPSPAAGVGFGALAVASDPPLTPVVADASRARTWSDVSELKNCRNGFCLPFLDGILKKTTAAPGSCFLQRLRTFSGDQRLMEGADGGGAPPAKCSSPETSRNGAFPRKRVECPF